MKPIIATVFACVMTIAVAFGSDQAADKSASRSKRQKASTVAARLDEMQISIQAQQQTIQQLQQQLQSRDTAIQQLQQQVNQLQTSATQADTSREASVTTVRNEVSELKSNVDSATASVQETKKTLSSLESPMAIHFKASPLPRADLSKPQVFIARITKTAMSPARLEHSVFRNRKLAAQRIPRHRASIADHATCGEPD